MEIMLIRHGETEWNRAGRIQGSSDIALNDLGRQQAMRLQSALLGHDFARVYSSDMQRVVQTARLGWGEDEEIVLDARLRELSFGRFEGYTWDELKTLYPEDFAIWQADREQNTHGGERISDVVRRTKAFLDEARARHERERILVFSHGGTIAIILSILMGLDPVKWWQFRHGNTAITEVRLVAGGCLLMRYNDTYHLEDERETV